MLSSSFFYRVIGFFGLLISGYYSIIIFFFIAHDVYDFGIGAFIPHMPNQIVSSTVEIIIYGALSLTIFFVIMYILQEMKLFSYTKPNKT